MTFARMRLYLAALLFAGWILYLAYLAINYAHPVIVSRSQVMVTEIPVIAEISLDDAGQPKQEVILVDDLRTGEKKFEMPGKPVVFNLADVKYPENKVPKAGRHLLLLAREDGGIFRVVPTPPSPGDRGGKLYIYPWLPDVEKQFRKLWTK